jgi:hypothetical protein
MNTRRAKMPKPMPKFPIRTKVAIKSPDNVLYLGKITKWQPGKFTEDTYQIEWTINGKVVREAYLQSRVSKYVLLYRAYERKLKLNAKKEKRDAEESRC